MLSFVWIYSLNSSLSSWSIICCCFFGEWPVWPWINVGDVTSWFTVLWNFWLWITIDFVLLTFHQVVYAHFSINGSSNATTHGVFLWEATCDCLKLYKGFSFSCYWATVNISGRGSTFSFLSSSPKEISSSESSTHLLYC